jgi:hypothetical protein
MPNIRRTPWHIEASIRIACGDHCRKKGMLMPAATNMQPFPADFEIKDIATNGTTLSVRVGGQGPAVVLLHGYGETAGFSQFAAFDQDAIDNKAFVAQGKLTMPVLAVGGEKSFGPTMAVVMRAAATDLQGEQVISASGHWLMEEQPGATIAALRAFLDRQP